MMSTKKTTEAKIQELIKKHSEIGAVLVSISPDSLKPKSIEVVLSMFLDDFMSMAKEDVMKMAEEIAKKN